MIVDYNTGEIICPSEERGRAKSRSRGERNDPINPVFYVGYFDVSSFYSAIV